MKQILLLLAFLFVCPVIGHAGPGLCRANAVAPLWGEAKDVPCSTALNGSTRVVTDPQGGDDLLADVKKSEFRYTTLPQGSTTGIFSADQLVKSGAGYVEGFTCYSDATATAGTIDIRDSIAAGTGNILYSLIVQAVAYTSPFTVPLYTTFATGLYFDYTTTADMTCMARYR